MSTRLLIRWRMTSHQSWTDWHLSTPQRRGSAKTQPPSWAPRLSRPSVSAEDVKNSSWKPEAIVIAWYTGELFGPQINRSSRLHKRTIGGDWTKRVAIRSWCGKHPTQSCTGRVSRMVAVIQLSKSIYAPVSKSSSSTSCSGFGEIFHQGWPLSAQHSPVILWSVRFTSADFPRCLRMKWPPSSIPPGARPLLSTKFRLLCSNDVLVSLPHRWLIWPIFPLRTECSLQDSSWATSFHSSRKRDRMFKIHPTTDRSQTWSLFPRSSRGWFWFASDLTYTCQSSSVHFSRHTDDGTPPRLLCSESSMIWTLAWSRVPRVFSFRWTSRLHSIRSTPTNYCSDWSLSLVSADLHPHGFVPTSRADRVTWPWATTSLTFGVVVLAFLTGVPLSLSSSPPSFLSSPELWKLTGSSTIITPTYTQLYTEVRSLDSTQKEAISKCVSALMFWFLDNGLQLNSSKTEAMIFGTRPGLSKLGPVSSLVIGGDVAVKESIKILGVHLDDLIQHYPSTIK